MSGAKLTINSIFTTSSPSSPTAYKDTHEANYYKPYSSTNTVGYDSSSQSTREENLISSLISSAKTYMTNNLDINSDTYVDALTFVYLGTSNANWNEILWPHQTTWSASIATVNSKQVVSYSLMDLDSLFATKHITKDSENNYIGDASTICHETGHMLGFADLYSYAASSLTPPQFSGIAVAGWDLMSANAVNVGQYLFSYERYVKGWLNDTNIPTLKYKGTYTLKPVCYDEVNNSTGSLSLRANVAYKLVNPSYPKQYFYLEYRKQDGTFDGKSGSNTSYGICDSGLLIYRVDTGVKLDTGYSDKLVNGNYYDEPYGIYVFSNKTDYSYYNYDAVLNATNNSFGSTDTNVTSSKSAITNQIYSSSKTQSELASSDVTYANSSIVISNVKINSSGELSFDITSSFLQDPPTDILNDASGIPDTNLYNALKSAAGVTTTYLNQNDLSAITSLNLANKNISSLTGLDKLDLTSLTNINLDNNKLTDISILSNFKTLQVIEAAKNNISTITGISALTSLYSLDLSSNNLSDVSEIISMINTNTKLYVSLMINFIDTISETNKPLLLSARVIVGLQGLRNYSNVSVGTYFINGAKYYYYNNNVSNMFTVTLNNSTPTLTDGEQNSTVSGAYIFLIQTNNLTLIKNMTITYNYSVQLKYTEINVIPSATYIKINENDNYTVPSLTYEGGNASMFNIETSNNVDKTIAGSYNISFKLTPKTQLDYSYIINIPVTVYNNDPIPNNETGIPDKLLYKFLLSYLGKDTSLVDGEYTSILYRQDFNTVTDLNITTKGITTLQGFDVLNWEMLESLRINDNSIGLNDNGGSSSTKALGNILSLKKLELASNYINDISFITNLTNLRICDLSDNKIISTIPIYNLLNSGSSNFLTYDNNGNLGRISLLLNKIDLSNSTNNFLISGKYASVFVVLIQNIENKYAYIEDEIQATSYIYNNFNTSTCNKYNIRDSLNQDITWSAVNGKLSFDETGITTGEHTLIISTSESTYFYKRKYTVNYSYTKVKLDYPNLKFLSTEEADYNAKKSEYSSWKTTGLNKSMFTFKFAAGSVSFNNPGSYFLQYDVTLTPTDSTATYTKSDTMTLYQTIQIVENDEIKNDDTGIPDINLYNALLVASKKATTATLYEHDTSSLTSLNLSNKNIKSITGLNYMNFDSLVTLILKSNSISDLTIFTTISIPQLENLDLSSNEIIDCSPLKNLSAQKPLSVCLFFNSIKIENADNSYIIQNGATYNNLKFLVGIQNLKENQMYIDNNATFTYCGANLPTSTTFDAPDAIISNNTVCYDKYGKFNVSFKFISAVFGTTTFDTTITYGTLTLSDDPNNYHGDYIEVHSTDYVDKGIVYVVVDPKMFTVEVSTTPELNIDFVGNYTRNYIITRTDTGEKINLNKIIYVTDTTAPVIKLIGSDYINLLIEDACDIQNDTYANVVYGYNASDNYDSSVKVTISGTVDVKTVGEYKISYYAIDKNENETTVYRTIKINYWDYYYCRMSVPVPQIYIGTVTASVEPLYMEGYNNPNPTYEWDVYKDGKLIDKITGKDFKFTTTEAGDYNVKLLLDGKENQTRNFTISVLIDNNIIYVGAGILLLIIIIIIMSIKINKHRNKKRDATYLEFESKMLKDK
jgi:M6 family metalloprotease-like protein